MFTKEAQELAKATVEAIKKIAERQEKECPECKGKGILGLPSCRLCKGSGRVKGKWEWEPEVGEWYYQDFGNGKLLLVKDEHVRLDIIEDLYVEHVKLTPLLHWEKIEEILEGMGYELGLHNWLENKYQGSIYFNNRRLFGTIGKSHQEAVMLAVIELARGGKK